MKKPAIWFEIDHNSPEAADEWVPNFAKLTLSEEAIACVEKVIATSAVSSALAGGGAASQKVLPEGSLAFFIITDWVDRSVRKPGSLSRGALRINRQPWEGRVQRPMVNVSPQGVTLKAWLPQRNKQWVSATVSVDEFRAQVRQKLSGALIAAMSGAMPEGEGSDVQSSGSKGPSPL